MAAFRDVRPWVFTPITGGKAEASTNLDPVLDTIAVEPEELEPFEAETVLAYAAVDVEAVRAEAHADGYAEGYATGLRQVRDTHRHGTRHLLRVARKALLAADELTQRMEREVVDLALAVAEKIIETEITMNPEIVRDTVRAALKELERSAIVNVRVHPADHAILVDHWGELIPLPLHERARLLPDRDIERGGCIVETRSGLADAQPRAKLTQIASLFDALLAGETV